MERFGKAMKTINLTETVGKVFDAQQAKIILLEKQLAIAEACLCYYVGYEWGIDSEAKKALAEIKKIDENGN